MTILSWVPKRNPSVKIVSQTPDPLLSSLWTALIQHVNKQVIQPWWKVSRICLRVKMESLPQILIYQSSQRHSLPDTLQLPTKNMFLDSLSRMAQYAAGDSIFKLQTQNSKLNRSCEEHKWYRRPCIQKWRHCFQWSKKITLFKILTIHLYFKKPKQ